jgi:hypothetical protein
MASSTLHGGLVDEWAGLMLMSFGAFGFDRREAAGRRCAEQEHKRSAGDARFICHCSLSLSPSLTVDSGSLPRQPHSSERVACEPGGPVYMPCGTELASIPVAIAPWLSMLRLSD